MGRVLFSEPFFPEKRGSDPWDTAAGENSMRRNRYLQALTLCLAALMLLTAPAAGRAAKDSLPEMLDRIFRNHHAVGGAVIVARDGEIVLEHYYGYTSRTDREPVTDETYFRLASVTKMVTAIRVMQLAEEGVLDPDRDISDYLGYQVRNPYSRKTPVTLRMLMTHTSSLDPHGGYQNGHRTLSELIRYDPNRKSNWYDEKPGTVYRYSNFGAGVIGSVLEAVTGRTIQDTVEEGVFIPMDITAAYAPCLLPDQENIPVLYNADGTVADSRDKSLGKEWDDTPDPETHYRINVGSLWMLPRDLCRIGMMLCDGGVWNGEQVLEAETVREMTAEQKGRAGIRANTPYGLGIQQERSLLPDRTVYGHQGLSDGVLCNLYFEPESQLVVVVCSNGCRNGMDNRVAHLTRKLFSQVWGQYGNPDRPRMSGGR